MPSALKLDYAGAPRDQSEPVTPHSGTPNFVDLPPGMAVCPFCGGKFFPWCLYSLYQVAAGLHVSVKRVRAYIGEGQLRSRLWARGSRVLSKMVDMRDLDQFLAIHRPYTDAVVPGSHALKLYHRQVDQGRKGGKTAQARRRALLAEQGSKPEASVPTDPQSKPKE